jgi:molybdate transport system substrate-binding protein
VHKFSRKLIFLSLCIALSVFAYVHAGPVEAAETGGRPAGTLIVFAVSSLADVFDELAAEFENDHPGLEVVCSYASSSTLAAQLRSGEIADVFASANTKQMTTLVDSGIIEEVNPAIFASNRLVVITPADNPAGVRSFEDIGRLKLYLVLAAPGVPARDYADEMAAKVASDPAYGDGFRGRFYDNLVSEESNVRQVAAKVALGEADAGIVYLTDVTSDILQRVRRFEIPDRYNVVAVYPIAVLKKAPRADAAAAFVEFVLSAKAKTTFARYGFGGPAN